MAIPIYFFCHLVYDNPEQSRSLALSATGTGSVRRTKDFSTMGFPRPLLHIGKTSFM